MLMFHSTLIQAFASGLVAGKMGQGSVYMGLKHSVSNDNDCLSGFHNAHLTFKSQNNHITVCYLPKMIISILCLKTMIISKLELGEEMNSIIKNLLLITNFLLKPHM